MGKISKRTRYLMSVAVAFCLFFVQLSSAVAETSRAQANARECSEIFSSRLDRGATINNSEFDLTFAGTKDRELSFRPSIRGPSYWEYLRIHSPDGERLLRLLQELGFRLKSGEETAIEAPKWSEFVSNYYRIAGLNRIPLDEIPHPALVFRRIGPNRIVEFRIVSRETERPPASEGWIVHNADELFNIPASTIARALRDGKFPLLDAFHDVGHFLAFLAYPEIAKSVLKAMNEPGSQRLTAGFKRRMYLAMEGGAFVKSSETTKISNFLQQTRGIAGALSLTEITRALDSMSEADLAGYASRVATVLEDSLAYFGGAFANPLEKFGALARFNTESHQNLDAYYYFRTGTELSQDISNIHFSAKVARTYFDQGPLPSIGAGAQGTEVLLYSFFTLATSTKALAENFLRENERSLVLNLIQRGTEYNPRTPQLSAHLFTSTPGFGSTSDLERYPRSYTLQLGQEGRQILRKDLVRLAAASEYVLRRSITDLTEPVMIRSLLLSDLEANSPAGRFLAEVFTARDFSRLYLGAGEHR